MSVVPKTPPTPSSLKKADLNVQDKENRSPIFLDDSLIQTPLKRPPRIVNWKSESKPVLEKKSSYIPSKTPRSEKKSLSSFPVISIEGAVRKNEFSPKCLLGSGSFGKVVLATNSDQGEVVAIKILERKKLLERGTLHRAHTEIRCLQSNLSPFIVKFKEMFQTRSHIYIIQEFCAGGELFALLTRFKQFDITSTKFYAAQIFSAIKQLHKNRFAYRDLKPENVMLDSNGNVKLIDFGLVKEGVALPDKGCKTWVGTNEYIAPEIILRKPYGYSVDYWALGIVIHELLTGLPPFYSQNAHEMHERVLFDEFDTSFFALDIEILLLGLLEKTPVRRYISFEVSNSAFFSNINWEDLEELKLDPPFRPDLCGEDDFKYFSSEFTALDFQF